MPRSVQCAYRSPSFTFPKISRTCFFTLLFCKARLEMYKDIKRTCTAIVLLKPFVLWRSRSVAVEVSLKAICYWDLNQNSKDNMQIAELLIFVISGSRTLTIHCFQLVKKVRERRLSIGSFINVSYENNQQQPVLVECVTHPCVVTCIFM